MDTIRHSQEEQAEMLGWQRRQRRKMWSCWKQFFLYLDGRMVHRRAGNYRLGVWDCSRGTADRRRRSTYWKRNWVETIPSCLIVLAEGAVRFGNCFVRTMVGPTLASCLDSLGKLNYPEYEVILVDDGSTDDTSYIAAQFPSVRYIIKAIKFESRPQYGRRHCQGGSIRLHRFRLAWLIRTGSIISLALCRRDSLGTQRNHAARVPMR